MVRARLSVPVLSVILALGMAPRAQSAEPEAAAAPDTIKVGIMGGMFKGVPETLVKAGGEQFGGLFKRITGLPGQVEVEDNHLTLAKKLDDNKLQLGVFHGFEWAWVKKQYPNLAPLAITIPPHLPQACIVVKANDPAPGPQALNGATIEIPFNMKAHGFLYLEKLEKTCPAGSFKVAPSDELFPEDGLDEVGKGRAKAVLVDASTLAAYKANNPGKAAKIKVLCQCDPLPQTVVVYNTKKLPAEIAQQLQGGLLKADKNSQGKAFLFLWNLRGFEEANAGFEDLLAKSLAAFPAPQKK